MSFDFSKLKVGDEVGVNAYGDLRIKKVVGVSKTTVRVGYEDMPETHETFVIATGVLRGESKRRRTSHYLVPLETARKEIARTEMRARFLASKKKAVEIISGISFADEDITSVKEKLIAVFDDMIAAKKTEG